MDCFIIFEQPTRLSGESLGPLIMDALEELSELARKLDVQPIDSFVSTPPEEAAGLLRESGREPDLRKIPALKWSDASEAVRTVRALREFIMLNPKSVRGYSLIVEDLEDLERLFTKAQELETRFYLAYDY